MSLVRNLALSIVCGTITLVLFALAYEFYRDWEYDHWRAGYQERGDWYNGLTIPSTNNVLMWEYRPDSVGVKWGTEIRTNNLGYRDRDHRVERDSNSSRVAFVGDSVTLGIGVAQKDTFTRRFEEIGANNGASRLEVLNFSVDGYDGIQVMELVTSRVLRFQPEIVVYILCMNDFDFDRASGGKIKYFRKPKNFFLKDVENAYQRLLQMLGLSEYHRYYFKKNKEKVLQHVHRVMQILREKGVEFRVVLMPVFPEHGYAEYPLTGMHRELNEKLRKMGIEVIDLLGSSLTRGITSRVNAFDIWHLNKRGHEQVARILARELLAVRTTPIGRITYMAGLVDERRFSAGSTLFH